MGQTELFNQQRKAAFDKLQRTHKEDIAARQEELAAESKAPVTEASVQEAHQQAAAAAVRAALEQATTKVRELDALKKQRDAAQVSLMSEMQKTARRKRAEAVLRAADNHQAAAQRARDARVQMAHKADAVIVAALGEATKENNNVQAKKNADEAARLEQERLDKESE